jgi:transcriptional regulator with XRE-family HTH domain
MSGAVQVRQVLGELLRARRNDCGLTAEQVGAMLNLSTQTILSYEQARASISVSRLFELATLYDSDPSELLRAVSLGMGMATSASPSAEELSIVARFGHDIARGAGRIRDPQVRRAVLNLLAELALGD